MDNSIIQRIPFGHSEIKASPIHRIIDSVKQVFERI